MILIRPASQITFNPSVVVRFNKKDIKMSELVNNWLSRGADAPLEG